METEQIIFFAIFAFAVVLNFIITVKYVALDKYAKQQQCQIKELNKTMREWQTTHSQCVNNVCIDKVLNDIIGDM
jgi:hypothetical protein